MSYFLWHTIVDMTANLLAIHDRDESDLWNPRYYYHYHMRGSRVRDPYGYVALWPRSKGMDPNGDGLYMFGGQDASDGALYEPLNFIETGSSRQYFIHGVCVDGAGNPLAAANLDLFLSATATSPKIWVSSGTTDSNGIYSLPTPYNGQNHFIEANYGPNTLVGASVNTLTPVTSPW